MNPSNTATLMEAVERLEETVYGNPSRNHRGLVERVNSTETYVSEIRADMKKITWLLLAGVVGAGLNLILNAKNIAYQHPAPPAVQNK